MTDRGLPIVDGAPACPFVAFEDDRDERASSPDHRHRCYAEIRPAPRALAHQEAYCLASAFPVCPTFQDWARREAAKARSAPAARPVEEPPRRNPPRDWSAPPPWASGEGPAAGRTTGGPAGGAVAGGAGAAGVAGTAGAAGAAGAAGWAAGSAPGGSDVDAPGFLTGRSRPETGLAGSAADRLAGPAQEPQPTVRAEPPPDILPSAASGRERVGEEIPARDREPARPRDDDDDEAGWRSTPPVAAAVGGPGGGAAPRAEEAGRGRGLDDDLEDDWDEPARDRRDPRDRGRGFADRRPRVGDTRRRRDDPAPSWEQPRRYEAYPTLKTPVGLPKVPRVWVMALGLLVAAAVLFMLPTLLGVGGPDDDQAGVGPTPSSSVAPSVSVAPTERPVPTPLLYVVQPGDTLSRIAARFNVTLAQLIEANEDRIPNPDTIAIGDELLIPTPPPEELPGSSEAASAAP